MSTNHRAKSIVVICAIENVLRNAVHHSPANQPVTVTVSQSSTHVLVDIVDQGSGVEESEIESLFDPFFRSTSALNDAKKNGTGLGLAIARRAVKKNGGTIRASNEQQGGLRVTIAVPLLVE